jgi:hypothetical protein
MLDARELQDSLREKMSSRTFARTLMQTMEVIETTVPGILTGGGSAGTLVSLAGSLELVLKKWAGLLSFPAPQLVIKKDGVSRVQDRLIQMVAADFINKPNYRTDPPFHYLKAHSNEVNWFIDEMICSFARYIIQSFRLTEQERVYIEKLLVEGIRNALQDQIKGKEKDDLNQRLEAVIFKK